MKTCRIVGAGDTAGVAILCEPSDCLIAADAGYLVCCERGLIPDLVVGDFDSMADVPHDVPVVRHPVEKDDTDMALAVEEGLARGYTCFVLYGGLGGRLDHTLANIQLLAHLAQQGCSGTLLDSTTILTVIADGASWQHTQASGTVSVFALSDVAEGVTIEGLQYSLHNATLHNTVSLGVSNAFAGKKATVSVESGTLLIVRQQSTEKIG